MSNNVAVAMYLGSIPQHPIKGSSFDHLAGMDLFFSLSSYVAMLSLQQAAIGGFHKIAGSSFR